MDYVNYKPYRDCEREMNTVLRRALSAKLFLHLWVAISFSQRTTAFFNAFAS